LLAAKRKLPMCGMEVYRDTATSRQNDRIILIDIRSRIFCVTTKRIAPERGLSADKVAPNIRTE
jgi:hypothetical protein